MPQQVPPVITLNAKDTGSGVVATYYTISAITPTAGAAFTRYDAASKPALRNHERVWYYSVDAVGNKEVLHSSAEALVW